MLKYKVATFEQIRKKFFPVTGIANIRRRLLKLKKDNYIESTWYEIDSTGKKFYSLNKKRDWKMILDTQYDIIPYHASSIVHDLNLNDIGEVLLSYSQSEGLYTENQVKGSSRYKDDYEFRPFILLNSDIIWKTKFNEKSFLIAVEYERKLKNKNDYVEKFRDYYFQQSINAVFYVVESISMMNKLMSFDKSVKQDQPSKLFFITKEKVLLNCKEIQFCSCEQTILKLNRDS